MGTLIAQSQKALATIKADAAAANSVPLLRAAVEALADQVQKLKDAVLGKTTVVDD